MRWLIMSHLIWIYTVRKSGWIMNLLNLDLSTFANSADTDQLASEEDKWSGAILFGNKYVN